MRRTVVIDYLPESVARYMTGYAIVAIDVVRATTTAISAVARGRRCFPVPTVDSALATAQRLGKVILAGEQRGVVPRGFDMNNSPSLLERRSDHDIPLVVLSSSGTRLCHEASACDAVFLACFRNYHVVARQVATQFANVAVIGAGTRGEFREEDQMCCAWIAESLIDLGYQPQDQPTVDIVGRWHGAATDAWIEGRSAQYLKSSGQVEDIDFILTHVADLSDSFVLREGEVLAESVENDASRDRLMYA